MTNNLDGQGDRRSAGRVRTPERPANMNAPSADRIAFTTCYMCACRCGIKVHLKDGRIRYIEGNRNHPVNKGVLCAKGSAGLMNHYSPARLQKPLKRVGPRGSGEYRKSNGTKRLLRQVSGCRRSATAIRASSPSSPAVIRARH